MGRPVGYPPCPVIMARQANTAPSETAATLPEADSPHVPPAPCEEPW